MASVQRISVDEIRFGRRPALADPHKLPESADLAHSIVAGKQRLDLVTEQSSVATSPSNLTAPSPSLISGNYVLSKEHALPLIAPFSRRKVDGKFLWISVKEGRLVVLDELQDKLMNDLCRGSPLSSYESSETTFALVAKLAKFGLIRGIPGQVDQTVVDAKRFLRIHLTERCNLSCIHCYADSGPNISGEGEMSTVDWIKVLQDFKSVGGERVLFTGGEALAHLGCTQLLQTAKSLGLHVTLFTNGILVPKHLGVISSSVDEVQISIDGASASTNDPIRGYGSYEKAVKAIDLLARRNVAVKVSTVAMRANWDDIRLNYISFAKRWEGFPVVFKINYGAMTHGRGEELDDELDVNITRPIVDGLMATLYPTDANRITRSTSSCGFAEQIVVAPNGEIHPCHLLSGPIASLRTDSLHAILDQLKTIQSQYDVENTIGCKSCDIRNLCGGTCRVENSKQTGNFRVTFCSAEEKLRKLVALKNTFF